MGITGTCAAASFITALTTPDQWQEQDCCPIRRNTGDSRDTGAPGESSCLSAPALSAMFIASLDDLSHESNSSCLTTAAWPKEPGRDLETAASAAVDILLGFILEDPQIPEGIKNPLRSAQLPILRLATRETVFFSSREHPVRRLISDISPLLKSYREHNNDVCSFTSFFSQGMRQLLQETTPKGLAFALFHAALREFVQGCNAGGRAKGYRNTSLSTSAMIAVPI